MISHGSSWELKLGLRQDKFMGNLLVKMHSIKGPTGAVKKYNLNKTCFLFYVMKGKDRLSFASLVVCIMTCI